jgi:UDP-N-acetylglucosamine diphosphorylase/glucosamine-1-phosphate N-acetyltransferase
LLDVEPNSIVFVFGSPAYINEAAMLYIIGLLPQNDEAAYHLHNNGRALQVYVFNGEHAGAFMANKAAALSVREITSLDSPLDFHNLTEHIRNVIVQKHVERGIIIKSPCTVRIDKTVHIEEDVVIESGTILKGSTVIGRGSHIGPHSVINNCKIGAGCTVVNSTLTSSVLGDNVRTGPYTNIRPNCKIGDNAIIGSFVELKNAVIGEGTFVPHLGYIGDAEVGSHVNFGCGCVTANFDGVSKHTAKIEDNAFIGCNSVLVSPVTVGDGAVVAAGSVITDDVPPDALALARSRQLNKENWALDRERNW